ncbi:FAD-dependent monooxygenase [Mesorhizobium sp. ES1-1]|uniref:FAD-dependent monooxygenase n=1 Tax=Mesorhizobium sp. ES1-1 TaxID=2876629 RepID=UPI001CC988B4|nr:FAD-dependent monooxygenase [Mesorhizobium sp. ES1-1]MBZ9674990.1 FAD-dependent monooxygenase [Mesorhizobium sp. ES1-1]
MDDKRPPPVVIAGAGVAGLTAAIAFAERGYRVHVFEQAARLEAVGAGLQLSPNATRILRDLGALDRLLPAAVRPQAVVLKDARTLRQLARVPLGQSAESRWRAPYLVAHRADLQSALMERVAEMPAIDLTLGARVRRLAVGSQGVRANVEIGGRTTEQQGSLLVGADGVWSSVRGLVDSEKMAAARNRFSGALAWRATVGTDSPAGRAFAAIGAADCVTTFLHPGFHMVAYPVSNGDAFNLVAITKGERIAEGWSGHADPGILADASRGCAPGLAKVMDLVDPWLTWPLHTVDQSQPWTLPGGIALIGDAAHAMTPFAAQGAAMAIEDAAMLADAVAGSRADPAAGLKTWEALRRPRIAKAARRGALNRLAWHAAGPVAIARNLFLKMRGPEKLAADLDWLYGWER